MAPRVSNTMMSGAESETTTTTSGYFYPVTIPDHDIPFPLVDLIYKARDDNACNSMTSSSTAAVTSTGNSSASSHHHST